MSVSTHLHLAVAIQRKHPPKAWKQELEKLPDAAREECRRYLRGLYYRAAVVETMKGNALCPTDPQPLPRPPSGT